MKVTLFEAPLGQVIFRLYLMMIVVIAGGLVGNIGVMSLGMILFLSAILAPKFNFSPGNKPIQNAMLG